MDACLKTFFFTGSNNYGKDKGLTVIEWNINLLCSFDKESVFVDTW